MKADPRAGSRAAAPASKLTYKDSRRLEELKRLMPERQKEITDYGGRDGGLRPVHQGSEGLPGPRQPALTAARAELEGI